MSNGVVTVRSWLVISIDRRNTLSYEGKVERYQWARDTGVWGSRRRKALSYGIDGSAVRDLSRSAARWASRRRQYGLISRRMAGSGRGRDAGRDSHYPCQSVKRSREG